MTTLREVLHRAVAPGGVPGMVAEVRHGRDRRFHAAGVADTATGREREPDERFRIGSITKAFTATVVLQLDAEGRLGLDDPADRWLPGLAGPGITVRHLLGHTSGLFNHTDDPATHSREGWSPEELVRIATGHPASFEPGAGWHYSNTNYVLAGMLAERITGCPLAEELERRVLRPLDLGGTYLAGAEKAIRGPHPRHYSTLFQPGPDAPVHDVTEMDQSWCWAAGGMVSTTGDLHRFTTALLRGELLPRAQHEAMFTLVPTTGADWIPDTGYGLGVFSQKLAGGVRVWGTGGANIGSWTYAMGDRDAGKVLVCQLNGDWNEPLGVVTAALEAEFA